MTMLKNPAAKYVPYVFPFDMSDRTWPSKRIEKAPRWLSTDLRDGNQALADPMDVDKKLMFFKLLVKVGLKEIE
ncbi:MAG TPA: 2-isopropylmalate synthase, partial [Asticcacaulis sp.]|nr:2-isopropylmalate synthase [Asticcacaulis sp.]